ncbi:MAG: SEL1-like repeat protein [Muribaculaceae bacterium]|nr:SEL1-like repeat protein [Muribaculaceae bacterium]
MQQSSTLQPGTVIKSPNSEYKIEKILGAGGFGITYLATGKFKVGNVPVEIKFAIKEHFMEACFRDTDGVTVRCTPSSKLTVEQSRTDFFNEAKRLQQICQLSENIVNVNETFEANGTAYYVMEYLDGGTLQKVCEEEAIDLILRIADAVNVLHENKLLHLDIKPDNIILKNNDEGDKVPVLIDFGLAKHFDKNGNPTSTPNAKGLSNGYAPIEQGGVIDEFSPTLDIYALGATLLYLLTGKNPPSSTELVDANQSKLKSLIPDNISDTTRNAILNSMKPNKDERTPDVSSFIKDLTGGKKEIKKHQEVSMPGSKTIVINQKKSNGVGRAGNSNKKKYILWGLAALILAPIIFYIISYCKFRIDTSRELKEIEAHNLIMDSLNNAFYNDDYAVAYEIANRLPDNFRAEYILGYLYEHGLGTEQNAEEAVRCYEKAAEKEYGYYSMLNLGIIYEEGEIVPQDYALAKKWYEKAAEDNYSPAMIRLGNMYRYGLGVPKDLSEAKRWYEKAVQLGDNDALENLVSLTQELSS